MAEGDSQGTRSVQQNAVRVLSEIVVALNAWGATQDEILTALQNLAPTTLGVSTVAGLPSAATAGQGARRMVTDANATTFNSIVAGGGANIVPTFSNGTTWRIG